MFGKRSTSGPDVRPAPPVAPAPEPARTPVPASAGGSDVGLAPLPSDGLGASIISPINEFWHNPTIKVPAEDVKKARDILAGAGYGSGFDDTPESQRSGLGAAAIGKRGGSLREDHSSPGSGEEYSSPEGLASGGRHLPLAVAPQELLQALADLLLEALGKENKTIPAEREVCDASQDHA